MSDSKTVKIRLLAPHFVRAGSQVGDEFDVDEALAKRLTTQGRAELVDGKPRAAAKSDTPDDKWKNDEIRAYAQERGIDLGDATKKDDMLAVIEAAGKPGGDDGQGGGGPANTGE